MKRLGRVRIPRRFVPFIVALTVTNGISVLLFLVRVIGSDSFRYWFLLWNLFLAWVPLLFASLLVYYGIRKNPWRHWHNVVLTVLWLSFLPNSFYLVSDLIHLQSTGEINILFDAVMFFSLICNGCIAGYISVYMVHKELLRRTTSKVSHAVVGSIFLASGFAIYLGRTLRWNSWDLVANPAGVLFDVSEGIVNPLAHPQIIVTTGTFFLLLSAFYAVLYTGIALLRPASAQNKPH